MDIRKLFGNIKQCHVCGTISFPLMEKRFIIQKTKEKAWCDEVYSENCVECGNLIYGYAKPKWVRKLPKEQPNVIKLKPDDDEDGEQEEE